MAGRNLSGFNHRRSGGFGGHQNNPIPLAVGPSMTISAILHDPVNGIYDVDIPVGAVPDHPFPYVWAVSRVWLILSDNESGSTGENYTNVQFSTGVSLTLLGNIGELTTQGDPISGELVHQALPEHRLESGTVLFVSPTRVGVASVDYDLLRLTVGFDLVGIRVG